MISYDYPVQGSFIRILYKKKCTRTSYKDTLHGSRFPKFPSSLNFKFWLVAAVVDIYAYAARRLLTHTEPFQFDM